MSRFVLKFSVLQREGWDDEIRKGNMAYLLPRVTSLLFVQSIAIRLKIHKD